VPSRYARALRLGDPSVVGRIDDGRLLLDLRCVPSAQDETLVAAVRRAGREH
jgi:L-seryl-tRNA(Ser) seleniumtransferase